MHTKIEITIIKSKIWKILSSDTIRQNILFALPKNENRDSSFLRKLVKAITGQSPTNRIPSVLHSEEGLLNTEIINEMNLYFTKVSDILIKDKQPFND